MPTETTKQVISAGQEKVDQFITDKFLRLFEASTEDDAQWKLARTNPQEFLRANKIKVPADLEVGFTEEPKVPDHLKKLLPTKKVIVKCFWVKMIVFKKRANGLKLPFVIFKKVCRLVSL